MLWSFAYIALYWVGDLMGMFFFFFAFFGREFERLQDSSLADDYLENSSH